MELKFIKDIADDKYQITVSTSAFSNADNELMVDFGEPEIEMGGQIIEGTAQVDQFDLTGVAAGVVTVNIQREDREEYNFSVPFNTSDTQTAIDLATAINAAICGVVASVPATPIFTTTSTFKGKAITYSGVSQVVITVVTPNAFNVIALLSSELKQVKTDLATYFKDFDTADYGDNTETVSLSYIDTITGRVTDGMEVLRQQTNTFTGETIITI